MSEHPERIWQWPHCGSAACAESFDYGGIHDNIEDASCPECKIPPTEYIRADVAMEMLNTLRAFDATGQASRNAVLDEVIAEFDKWADNFNDKRGVDEVVRAMKTDPQIERGAE